MCSTDRKGVLLGPHFVHCINQFPPQGASRVLAVSSHGRLNSKFCFFEPAAVPNLVYEITASLSLRFVLGFSDRFVRGVLTACADFVMHDIRTWLLCHPRDGN